MFGYKEIQDGIDALLIAVAEVGYKVKALDEKLTGIGKQLDEVLDKPAARWTNAKADAAYFDKKTGLYSSKKSVVKEG